jgi:chromate reductase
MFIFLNGMVLNKPEVMIANASQRFDEQGRLTDEKTREFIRGLLIALKDWTERLRR